MMAIGQDFTHFDAGGNARMVDVGAKADTKRVAVAAGRVLMDRTTLDLIRSGGVKKGDVLTVARVAGIMGAKRTPELIPMCHPVAITGVELSLRLCEGSVGGDDGGSARLPARKGEQCAVEIEATVSCTGPTGVEMEALTAVSAAALTVYDMCKAVQRDMVIDGIRLLKKTGGASGEFIRED